MRLFFWTIIAFGLVFFQNFSVAYAASSSNQFKPDCNPELFKEIDSGSRSLEETLAILETVDSSNFHLLKKDTSGKAIIPVKGIPVNFGADIASFEERRSELRKTYQSNYVKAQYEDWLKTTLSGQYSKCLEAYVRTSNAPGLYLFVNDPTNTAATILLRWVLQSGHPGTDITLTADGAQNFPPFNARIIATGEKNFVIKHSSGSEVRIIAQDSVGNSVALSILPPPTVELNQAHCTKTNPKTHECERCEFKFDDMVTGRNTPIGGVCGSMPVNELVNATFVGKYTTADMGGGGNSCASQDVFRGADRVRHQRNHSGMIPPNCTISLSGVSSGFVKPLRPGRAEADIALGCGYNSGEHDCYLNGTLYIFTVKGQP